LQSTGLERDNSIEELADIALMFRERVNPSPHQRYRLVGVGVSNFREAEPSKSQLFLFE
jgi:DNA polymerase-4